MIIGREIGGDHGETWLATRQRVRDLLTGRTPAEMARPVPAMPGLTVHDVLSGLIATAAAALDGDIHATYAAPGDGGGRAAGTDAELLSAWDAQADGVAALVRDDPRAGRLLIDLVTHEHDLRGALDCPGARADDAVAVAVELLASEFAARLRAVGVPALRLTCEQWGYETAPPPVRAILVADRFELFRGFTGRRSAAEVRRWMWSDDPGPYLPYLSDSGSLRATDLDEPDPDVPPEYAERLRTRSWREPVG
ncbi:MAG TPA: hypothetical protein VH136_12915 [Trebonia sp.]|nr:hypothetical protein [Trebonia sp.]